MYVLLTKRKGQDGWLLATFPFCVFMDFDFVSVHKSAKRERGQYPAILIEKAWSLEGLLYGIPRLNVALCVNFFVCRFSWQNAFLKLVNIFVFFIFFVVDTFGFHVPSGQRSRRKSFYSHGKYFAEKKLSCTGLNFGEILLREQNGQFTLLRLNY